MSQKSFMQKVFEWSLRNQSDAPSTAQVDVERIEWLRKAWESQIVDGATLLRGCIGLLEGDDATVYEQALEQLADLLENVDNAVAFGLMEGWKKLLGFYARQADADLKRMVLQCFSAGLQNAENVQQVAIAQGLLQVVKECLGALTASVQKPLLAILSALYQQPQIAKATHQTLDCNFMKIYADSGFGAQPRYEHLRATFAEAGQEDAEYNALVRRLVE